MVIIGVDDMIEMILFLKIRFALIKLITCEQSESKKKIAKSPLTTCYEEHCAEGLIHKQLLCSCVSAGSLMETRCLSCGDVTLNKRNPICPSLKGKG